MKRLRLVLALLLGILWLMGSVVLLWAQQDNTTWAEPINLSHSGGTTNPIQVVDNSGDLHVFWQDQYLDAYVYQQNEAGVWSTPVTVTVPFTATVPRLLFDHDNRLHAFWRYAKDGNDTSVKYSSVPITGVANFVDWASVQTVASAAADLDVALDAEGQIHLLYAQSEETANVAAGIYHTTIDAFGAQQWLTPTLLYESPYFRGLEEMNANVELVTAVSGNDFWLLAAWDNRPRKQLFFARSGNGGEAWETPIEVVGPESGSSAVAPFNIQIAVKDDNVVLVWNKGQPGVRCEQYSRSSADRGVSWSESWLMDDLLPGTANCVSRNELVAGAELIFLLSTVQNQQFMWAWDGGKWSSPVSQPILTGFDNPETLNAVVFRCQQLLTTEDDQLLVIGCEEDVRTYGDGDIWLLSRPLGSANSWFPPPTEWQPIELVDSSSDPYYSLALTSGIDGEFLAFWTLADGSGSAEPSITNARMTEGEWLLPEIVLAVPRVKIASPLALATTATGQLYITWSDSVGQLNLARTAVSEAHIASSWSPVDIIPLEHQATSPVLGVEENGTLYLAYTIPVNEGRGIYMLTSTDGGRSWSEPITVFDGLSAGWEVVGPAKLGVSSEGTIHLLWGQETLLSGSMPQTQALYYTHSEDGGQTFTSPMMVASGIITWSDLVTAGEQAIHQFWRTTEDHSTVLQHAYSQDGGQSWSQPDLIDSVPGEVAVAGSETGAVSLLLLEETAVHEWRWQNGKWTQPIGLSLDDLAPADTTKQKIAAALASDNVLATLFTGQVMGTVQVIDVENEEVINNSLQASSRVVDVEISNQPPLSVSTTIPVPAPTAAVDSTQPAPIAEASPVPTATAVASVAQTETAPGDNATTNLLLGVVPLGLLVLVVFGIGFWSIRRRSH